MSKILALVASGGCGKSDTLLELIKKFPAATSLRESYELKLADDVVIDAYNGKKVGISTDSDMPDARQALIDLVQDHKCDTIICACHPRMGGHVNVRYITDYFLKEHSYEFCRVDQCLIQGSHHHDILAIRNAMVAELIYKIVE